MYRRSQLAHVAEAYGRMDAHARRRAGAAGQRTVKTPKAAIRHAEPCPTMHIHDERNR